MAVEGLIQIKDPPLSNEDNISYDDAVRQPPLSRLLNFLACQADRHGRQPAREGRRVGIDVTNPDWDPAEEAASDHLAACDVMRASCPVAYSDRLGWSLFRHADVTHALQNPGLFSNAVSAVHTAVPNGLDPPLHTGYRRIIDRYFDEPAMRAFEPACQAIARGRVGLLATNQEIDIMREFASPFALDVQCAFVGWPVRVQSRLRTWLAQQRIAVRGGDTERLRQLAGQFDSMVKEQVTVRSGGDGSDATSRLARERIEERALTTKELCAILRNWTVGELATLAASLGIVIFHLAHNRKVQRAVRKEPGRISYAVDEILRLHAPLLSNRRVVTRNTSLGDRTLCTGEKVSLMWAASNRDEQQFANPKSFRWGRDLSKSLLYGAGIHRCPGEPLARMELRLALEALLSATEALLPGEAHPRVAKFPSAGFESLPVLLLASRA